MDNEDKAMGNTLWTEAQVEQLRALLAQGLSSGLIAAEMGVSRNTICGKAHRMALSESATTSNLPREPRKRKARVRSDIPTWAWGEQMSTPEPVAPLVPDVAPSCDGGKTLVELGHRDCRWPYGDPRLPGFRFCAQPQHRGFSYCRYHAIRATAPDARARIAA